MNTCLDIQYITQATLCSCFVWIVMQKYAKSKAVFGPNRLWLSVLERNPYCLTTFMLKLHEIQHPINKRTYPGCVALTGSKVNAGGREAVSNGGMTDVWKIMLHMSKWRKSFPCMMQSTAKRYVKQNQDNQHSFLSSDVWLLQFLQSKASAVFWLHFCKSPLFESHSFPCGCLATPFQHNIVRITRAKRDRCLLKTTSQGCFPIMESALSTAAISASDLIQVSSKKAHKKQAGK